MSLNTLKYFVKLSRKTFAAIDNTAAPGIQAAVNAGTDPSRVVSLFLLGDSADRTIEVYHHNGTTYKMIYTGTLLANAGRGSNNPALELVSNEGRVAGVILNEGNLIYELPNGHSIYIRTTAAPTVAVDAVATIKDFAV